MRISKLRLAGFKSFVEPAELHIASGLTGVVGPNGCGKSNLLEAIRWVMGESSPKSMRGAGMEDVIFAGTSTRPQRDFAEVALYLERDEADLDGDTEAEVVRRIERGAGSAYRINGRDVRAKDVALLFADSATGAHSPALVSQGRISAIISAKPAERRAMLEEAAGIAGLHVRRKDAEQKLRATETNLARLDDILADMESRANALRRQARAAEKYRQLSDEIRTAEARLIFARWRDASAAADRARAEAAHAEEAVQTSAEAQRVAAALQGDATRKLADVRAEAMAAREAESALSSRLTLLQGERAALERRIEELARQRAAFGADRAREDQLALDAAEAIARLEVEEKALGRGLAGAEVRRAAVDSAVAEATEAVRSGEVALAKALATEAAQQADLRVAEAAVAAARQRLARATAEAGRVADELEAMGDGAAFTAQKAIAGAARAVAEQAGAAAQAQLADAEARRDAAAEARQVAEAAGSSARAALAALEAEARALEKANASEDGDRLLAHVSADPGYEHALAAALGDDLETPLGRWGGGEVSPADPKLPDGATPLAGHVRAPVALARRLAQVGVVEADEAGLRLAVGQRLVTRDGNLRRWDGYRSSGGGAAAAERLIRANRLAALEAQLPGARAEVEAAGAGLAKANDMLVESRTVIEVARAALATAEQAARTAARDEDAATSAIERHAAARSQLAERCERAQAEVAEAKGELARAETARADLPPDDAIRAEVAQLKAAGDAARSGLADARAAAATLAQSLEADRQRRDAARAEARNWRARAGDASGRIAEMDRRLAAAEAEAQSLEGAPARIAADIEALAGQAEAARARAVASQEAERSAEAELRKLEAAAALAGETLANAREARAGAIARFENMEQRRVEMGQISGERFECPAPVLPAKAGFDEESVHAAGDEQARFERLTAERERLGPVNLVAETELAELDATRIANAAEREELAQAVARLRGSIGSLNREGRARLLAAFEAVDQHFRRLFTTLFAGGEAHLALIDSDDPLEAGLEIMAQPPGKKLGSLTLLSGGEQALTAVALIFALFLTNPAPICVLDEVDAPLDDANIERFCDLLVQMTQETDTRYLIVTHNAVTMSRMHRLFGVTMVERGVSRLVSVDLGGAERLLAAE